MLNNDGSLEARRSLFEREVLTSYSHRGFSPVIQKAKRNRPTVSTVFLGVLK
jgi:hypothetical protein